MVSSPQSFPIPADLREVALGVAILKGGEILEGLLDPENALDWALGKSGSDFKDQPAREAAAWFIRPSPTCQVKSCRDVIGLRQVMTDFRRRHGGV